MFQPYFWVIFKWYTHAHLNIKHLDYHAIHSNGTCVPCS
jgi:hypothetical protein